MPYENGDMPQVGDRVRVVHAHVDGSIAWPPIGAEGTVRSVYMDGRELGVDFSEVEGCPTSCGNDWWCYANRVEPAGPALFYLVEPHLGQFRPIPDGQTFSDGKKAADRAKRMSAERGVRIQVRPIAKDVDGGWREREAARLADGTYPPMPSTWDLPPQPDHFLHLAKEDTKMVAYTESPEKGVLDRQTRVTPGRYLERFYNHLSQAERMRYIAMVDKPDQVHFTSSAEKIEWVYRNGPRSCMSHGLSEYDSSIHPTRVYGKGDLHLAYLLSGDGSRVTARAVVWKDKKLFGRRYGDSARLEKALDSLGYTNGYEDRSGAFIGAKLKKILDPKREGRYVLPYLDGGYQAVDENPSDPDAMLVLTGGDEIKQGQIVLSSNDGGLAYAQRFCPRYRCWMDAEGFARIQGEDEEWSREALSDYAAQVLNEETKTYEWWPRDKLVRVGGSWLVAEKVGDKAFKSDYSEEYCLIEDMFTLDDGRRVSRREWSLDGYTCAGSGRQCIGWGREFGGGQFLAFGRTYSYDWLRERARDLGMSVDDVARHLQNHGRLPDGTAGSSIAA